MDVEKLLNETDPRSFLRSALKIQKSGAKPISVAEFSRHCGFSSRSFLSEYLSGKKKLSKESLRSIRHALNIPKMAQEYFALLVGQEQPELSPLSQDKIAVEILRLRKSFKTGNRTPRTLGPLLGKVVSKKKCFLVYASLGDQEQGASLEDILKRSKLSKVEALRNIEILETSGLVTEKKGRYFANETAVDMLNFTGKELGTLVGELGREIATSPAEFTDNPNNLVLYSVFSVETRQLAAFKERLRDAVYKVMDEFQSENGNSTQQVFICSKN
ncbi:hypothetical protein AZI86_18755 [Bdellovibrio bacteriovorus]|uniref:Uncharacterized protein n=1 Tax=Bdellovibrio bacteriovorus TaxID=959 RepID=A0A150WDG0_BDEBC|nr:hypothetical protein [Bdellovibrio bacteriovorus]KYG60959.1 hypothetical protein AZI86_18755 [Bdellovibrio bacteriovorus]